MFCDVMWCVGLCWFVLGCPVVCCAMLGRVGLRRGLRWVVPGCDGMCWMMMCCAWWCCDVAGCGCVMLTCNRCASSRLVVGMCDMLNGCCLFGVCCDCVAARCGWLWWARLAAVGRSWLRLIVVCCGVLRSGPAGFSWLRSVAVACVGLWLVTHGCDGLRLAVVGCGWLRLVVVGCGSLRLVAVGCGPLLLVAVRCGSLW